MSHQWRLRYYRPASIGFAGVTLTILSLIALMASPFLLVFQQMNGGWGYFPDVNPFYVAGAQAGISGTLCILSFFILRGHNWARWGFLLFGAAVLGLLVIRFASPWEGLPALGYVSFAVILFRPTANDFFNLAKAF